MFSDFSTSFTTLNNALDRLVLRFLQRLRLVFQLKEFHIRISPYWIAVLSALFGFLLRLAIDPWLGDQMPYITFIVAVALVGLFAGVGPALLSTALGAGIAYFCFVPPRYQWGFQGMSDAAGFFSYLAAAFGIVLLIRARRKAYGKAEQHLQQQLAAEGELHDAQKLFQLFMDNRPSFSYLRERTGQYVYFNKAARTLLGLDCTFLSTLPEAFAELQEEDEEAFRSDTPHQFINKLHLSSGERYWLTTKFVFINQEQQTFVGSVSRDITEQVRAEELLVEKERLLAATQMLATVAHEVNNPLAAVTQSVFLLRKETLPPRARELTEIAQQELSRLVHITRLVLGFYKLDEHPIAVDPCDALNDAIESLSRRFPAMKARIIRDLLWEGAFEVPTRQVREVLENILTNAIESGATEIRARISQGIDWQSLARSGCRIFILDDGHGMSAEQRKQAFQPFFSTKDQKGSGLGLWVSKAIVQKNGGTISLRSTDSASRHGTCVSIFLPKPSSQKAAAGAHRPKWVKAIEDPSADHGRAAP